MGHLQLPVGLRGVVFDVGETLVDESRAWAEQAEAAGVSPFALMGALGALIERNEDHQKVWDLLGVEGSRPASRVEAVDLYPDALACLRAVRARGLVVGIAGNQPRGVESELRAVGFEADFIASSAAWGVAKPSAEFFSQTIHAAGLPADTILYVGDRLDNDVIPARRAGMKTAFIRRGPWGYLHAKRADVVLADIRLDSLDELTMALN